MDSKIKRKFKVFFEGPERGKLKDAPPEKLMGLRISIISAFVGITGALLTISGLNAIGTFLFVLGFIGIFIGVISSQIKAKE